jgi:hypothetical protein
MMLGTVSGWGVIASTSGGGGLTGSWASIRSCPAGEQQRAATKEQLAGIH